MTQVAIETVASAQARQSFVNVKDHGALGDGAANDAVAIDVAISAVTSTGGTVFFPPGVYMTDATIDVPGGVNLVGTGLDYGSTSSAPARGSIIRASGSSADPVVKLGDTEWDATGGLESGKTGAKLTDLVIDGAGVSPSVVEIYGARCYVSRCQIYRGTTYALNIDEGQNSYVEQCVIGNDNVGSPVRINGIDNKIIDCQVRGQGTGTNAGIFLDSDCQVAEIRGNHIFSNSTPASAGPDIWVRGGRRNQIVGNMLDWPKENNHIFVETAGNLVSELQIVGNMFYIQTQTDNTYFGIRIDTTGNIAMRWLTCVGNVFSGFSAGQRLKAMISITGPNTYSSSTFVGNVGAHVVSLWDGNRPTECAHNTIYDGSTKPQSKFGTFTGSGDGSTTVFNIAHGLAGTPVKWSVTPNTAGAAGAFYVTADATNLVVTYSAAPASGTSNVKHLWSASL